MSGFGMRRRRRQAAPGPDLRLLADAQADEPRDPSRRRFVGYSAVGGSIIAAGLRLSTDPAMAEVSPEPSKTFTRVLRRREDQLRVAVEFWNLQVDTGPADSDTPATLRKVNQNQRAYLVYQFGPQHLADEAFFTEASPLDDASQPNAPQPAPSTTEALKPAGQVRARLAGGTRLAFEVPDAALPLRFTTAQLLDWLPLRPRVVSNALPRDGQPNGAIAPEKPSDTETAIEYPWRLVLSPHAGAGWAHDEDAVDHGTGRYELWHTRLGVRGEDADGGDVVDEVTDDERTLRVVWANDPGFETLVSSTNPPAATSSYAPFRMSLAPRDRLDLVRLSSDWRLPAQGRKTAGGKPFEPGVVDVDSLMLSSLGGWLDSSFTNELQFQQSAFNSSLLQWQHIGAMGRDSYARVVRKGYLFPFGFKAALVTVTERRFERPTIGSPKGAYLRQRIFIVVLKADRRFGGLLDDTTPYAGKALPFRRMVCTTRITPDLADPTAYDDGYPGGNIKELFVPRVAGQPFRFQMRGFDWVGAPHTFDAPVVWVDDTKAYAANDVVSYVGLYHEDAPLRGSRIAFAEEDRPGDTTFPAQTLRFAGAPVVAGPTADELAARGIPGFVPVLEQATIALSDAGRVAGAEIAAATMKPFQGYLEHGFGSGGAPGAPNRGDVFLDAVEGAPGATVGVSTRNAGGMAAPALPVKSISRILGPSGPAGGGGQNLLGGGVSDGAFDPGEVLDDGVKILGGIALVEVLAHVGDFVSAREKALKITSTRAEDPHRVITEVDWHPDLQAAPPGLHLLAPVAGAGCDIHAEIAANLDDPEASSFRIDGEIRNVVVNLFGGTSDGEPTDTTFVRVPFQRLTFRAGTMVAETMEPVLGDVTFHGPLSYLDDLARYMALVPGAGGGGGNLQSLAGDGGPHPATGPYLDVTATGVEAGIGLALPEIGIGVMTLSNLSLAAGLRIPFDGSRVTLTFSFASRDNPFSLTVWGLGGGGFAAMTFSIDGVEGLEFSLEFGAAIGISIGGLASGKVELKAGINFKIETLADGTQQCTLTAYVRLRGAVDILGLIEVSLTFYVALSFIVDTRSLAGEATLTIEIDLVVFSESVELTVRKEIAGPGSGSTLQSMRADSGPLELEAARVTWADLLTQPDWDKYCTTFATVGA